MTATTQLASSVYSPRIVGGGIVDDRYGVAIGTRRPRRRVTTTRLFDREGRLVREIVIEEDLEETPRYNPPPPVGPPYVPTAPSVPRPWWEPSSGALPCRFGEHQQIPPAPTYVGGAQMFTTATVPRRAITSSEAGAELLGG